MAEISTGLKYLISFPGIVTIAEFVVLSSAFAPVAFFLDKAPGILFSTFGRKESLQLFMVVTTLGWALVTIQFVFFIAGLHEKISRIIWQLTVVMKSAIWAVLLLISSALVADAVDHYDSLQICKVFPDLNANFPALADTSVRCGHLIAGAVFGFFGMVLFIADTVFYVIVFFSGGSAPQANGSAPKPSASPQTTPDSQNP